MEKEFIVPFFDGFYNSYSEDVIERYEEENPNEDHSKNRERLAIGFVKSLSNLIKLDVKFIKIISPKEYNFTTDKIVASCDEEQLQMVWKKVQKNHKIESCFKDTLDELLTPSDGFIPSYSYDPLDWIGKNITQFNDVEVGIIIQAYCVIEDVSFDSITEQPPYYEALC